MLDYPGYQWEQHLLRTEYSSLTVEADVNLTGDAKVDAANTVRLSGDLVTGDATTISGDAEISGPLTVQGDLVLQNTNVTNLPVTCAGDLVIDEELDIDGDTHLSAAICGL
jgi:predicted acyltransferase (DUF342 family)